MDPASFRGPGTGNQAVFHRAPLVKAKSIGFNWIQFRSLQVPDHVSSWHPCETPYSTSHLRFRICIRQPSTQGYQISYSIGCKHKLSREKATAFPQLFIVPHCTTQTMVCVFLKTPYKLFPSKRNPPQNVCARYDKPTPMS